MASTTTIQRDEPARIIFSGTFSPIHYGHLQVACEVLNRRDLFDAQPHVYFSPISCSFSKEYESLDHRVRMLELALADEEHASVLHVDAGLTHPRSNYQRLLDMEEKPGFWIMGSDSITEAAICQYEVDKVAQAGVKILCVRRHGHLLTLQRPWIIELEEPKVNNTISSELIKQMVSRGEDCSAYLPKEVLWYIHEHCLYASR